MRTVVCIVEGDGEVQALPLLLRRIALARGVFDLKVGVPIRVHRDQSALTAVLDIEAAVAGSRSFRKFVEECERALAVIGTTG